MTLGVGAFVHYGVVIGDGAVLAPDSFLMKGEEVPADELWGGNPANRMHEQPVLRQARTINSNHDDGTAVLVHAR